MLSFVVIAALHARQPLPASPHISASSGPATQTFAFPPLAHSSQQPQFSPPLFSITCALLCCVPVKPSCFFSARCTLFAQKAGGRGLPIFSSATGHGTRVADHISVFFCISRTVPQRSASFSDTSGFRTEKSGGNGYPHTDYPSRFGTRLPDGLALPQRQCTPTISGRRRLPQRQMWGGPWRRRRALSSSCTPDISGASSQAWAGPSTPGAPPECPSPIADRAPGARGRDRGPPQYPARRPCFRRKSPARCWFPSRLAPDYQLFSVDRPPADGLSCWLTVHSLLAQTELSPSERRAKGRTYEPTLSGRLHPSGLVFDFPPKPCATAFRAR